ncbi:class I SAM-dependent methyltransferase [Flavobacterium urocaniciphilum]|uniref:Methyltransferase domain-containing protein n=1 Tax=Flavobacterium urocaniciphilum TaxID=1299341 RepID=A0A1H8Z6F6_9FLAO|nr:class I SAM-dependent methyltransferase [Flavobacterium urocaniciphilum]SEP59837.1 Methyltransferase domain-containing protein [Flavobacterium urocaniciphilum]
MISKRKLYYLLSPSMRYSIRKIYYFPSDFWDLISGKRDKTIPPKGLIFIGPGDFKRIGEHYLNIFKEQCNLLPNHRVLDVGCGIGRIAIPLTNYLNKEGSYEGFDIVKNGIDWCQKNITQKNPNFKFTHIDLKNDLYNLKTEQTANNFVFPYQDSSFDLVVLTSVFTHMMPDDVVNYIKEINRVLKPNGKCLVTFFILNEESKNYMKSNSDFNFQYNFGDYSLMDKDVKEANIAFEEKFIFNCIKENNLTIEKTLYGFWSGRPKNESFDYQDTLILTK